METKNQEFVEIDPIALLRKLWAAKFIIVFVAVVLAVATLLVNLVVIRPTFESTTRVYVVNQTEDKAVTTQDLQLGNFLVKDYKEIILSDTVMSEVINSENLSMTPSQLKRVVKVDSPRDTRILSISVSDRDPQKASNLANRVREVASEQIKRVTKVNDVTTLEEAKPTNIKSSPKTRRNTFLAAALGFLLSAGYIVVRELLDDRVRYAEDVEDGLGLVLLGIVPQANHK
ncbi:Wzz/FepE/Etk N-terminal domain-containing protein [uncultured Abiotrophia sp.]|uniref:Wzz/FepE/Etk N-terminal domain-containing protein n=1 Tax=uncultured Abiotrophia sp. TaxID=316094 RepID=UPI0028D1B7F9|nr:Wzz/FepE/Etk N-terminal domain-containing protein [uncultured Abiotrophia sp.]